MFLSFGARDRKSHSRTSAVLLVGLSTFVWTLVQGATVGTIRGTVVDSQGAVVWMAHVVIHADLTGRQAAKLDDQRIRTGRDGRFALQLDSGFYDVCIMADAFVPTCRKITVETGKTVEPRFRLDLDLNVIKHVADTFPTARRPQ